MIWNAICLILLIGLVAGFGGFVVFINIAYARDLKGMSTEERRAHEEWLKREMQIW